MLRAIYFIRSIRLRELRGQTSSSANGRWKVLENSVRDVFSSRTPTKYAATKCRELPRHIAGDPATYTGRRTMPSFCIRLRNVLG